MAELTATEGLICAAKEAREALAACCRFVYQLGLVDEFSDYLQSQGINDGFGVRLQDAIAGIEAPEE